MGRKLITAPVSEPITLAEAKLHLRTPDSADDTLITALITTARQVAEEYTARAFLTQTWELWLDSFGCYDAEIELPLPPLQSVTTLKYKDTSGTLTTLASDQYQIDTAAFPVKLKPAYGITWPSIQRNVYGAVQVRFICGWTSAAEIPAPIKAAMLLLIGHYYNNRESVVVGTIAQQVPDTVNYLLDPYRCIPWG